MKNVYTLITGASTGLGLELAIQCSKKSQNLILISLPNENLQEVAKKLEDKYGIKTVCFEADLTNTEEIRLITDSK